MIQKLFAEFIGTFILVIIGCGAVVFGGYGASLPLGALPIAIAFGLAVVAMAYGIGPISGCHINPAVSLGMWMAGRIPFSTFVKYSIAHILGALAGATVLLSIASTTLKGFNLEIVGLGQNGWGSGYLGEYTLIAALLTEVIATFIFILVILGVTYDKANSSIAGLVIGLTLVVIHITFINITGVSVNPARSFGPAILVGGKALDQLWLFIFAPLIGAALAGVIHRGLFCSSIKKDII